MATKRKADNSPNSDIQSKKSIRDEDYKNQNEKGEKFRFLLVGKTGSGKSSTGNTILGQPLFSTAVSFSSVTDQCQLHSAVRLGTSIDIMDSPGLFDTDKSNEEVSTLLMQAVACMHPGPDAIFYILKMERYRKEEFAVYNRLKALLDEDVTRHMILVITHGDSLKGRDMEELLQTVPDELAQVLEDCNRRYVVLDNTLTDAEPQVQKLLDAVRELKQENGNVPYSCPKYASVAESFEKELNRRLAEVEEQELRSKEYVQELSTKLEETEEKARQEKKKFEEADRQRQRAMEEKQQQLDKQCDDLTQALKQQQLNEKQRLKQVEDLEKKLAKEREEFEAKMERERQEQAERLRRLDEERERQRQQWEAERKESERRERESREEAERQLRQEVARCRKKKKKCAVM